MKQVRLYILSIALFAFSMAALAADATEISFGPFKFKVSSDWQIRKGLVGNNLLTNKSIGVEVLVHGVPDTKIQVDDEFIRDLARSTKGYTEGGKIAIMTSFGNLKGKGKSLEFTAAEMPRRLIVFSAAYPKAFSVFGNPAKLNGLQITAEGPANAFDDSDWLELQKTFTQTNPAAYSLLKLPSYDQYLRNSKEDRLAYITDIRALLAEMENDLRAKRPEMYGLRWLQSLWMEVADAQTDERNFCIFAGNVSQSVKVQGVNKCVRPSHGACSSDEVPCNGSLYGYREGDGGSGKPFCVNADNFATSNCEKKGKSAAEVSGSMTREDWQFYVSEWQANCADPAPRQKVICAKIVKRIQLIAENAKPAEKPVGPAVELPPAKLELEVPMQATDPVESTTPVTLADDKKRREDPPVAPVNQNVATKIGSTCEKGKHAVTFNCEGHDVKLEWHLEVPKKPMGTDQLVTVPKVFLKNARSGKLEENKALTTSLRANISKRETLDVAELYPGENYISKLMSESKDLNSIVHSDPDYEYRFTDLYFKYSAAYDMSQYKNPSDNQRVDNQELFAAAHKKFWGDVEADSKKSGFFNHRKALAGRMDSEWRKSMKDGANKRTCTGADLFASEPKEESFRQVRKVEQGLVSITCSHLRPAGSSLNRSQGVEPTNK